MAEIENLENLNLPASSPAVPDSSRSARIRAELGRRLNNLWNHTLDLVEMPLAFTTFALMWIQLFIALFVAFFYSTAYPPAAIALFLLVPVVLVWMGYEIPGFGWTEICSASVLVLVPLHCKFSSFRSKEKNGTVLVKTFWSIGISLVNIAFMLENEDHQAVGCALSTTSLFHFASEGFDAFPWVIEVLVMVYIESPDSRTMPPHIVSNPLFSVFSGWVARSNYTLSYGDIDQSFKTSGSIVNANHLFFVNVATAVSSALLALVVNTRKRNLIAQRRKERAERRSHGST